jgi:hypothetical protein
MPLKKQPKQIVITTVSNEPGVPPWLEWADALHDYLAPSLAEIERRIIEKVSKESTPPKAPP